MTPPSPDDDAPYTAWREQWLLPPDVTYLNHGSFGPSPRVVVEARQSWYERLESQPMNFLARQLEPEILAATDHLARFVGTVGENLVLLENSTVAVNVVAASVPLAPGDEVLLTDHEYGAVERIWRHKCEQCGARLVVQPLGDHLTDAEEVAEAFLAGATPRTQLVVFSHVTSPTAVVLPAAEITRRARARGLTVCIDGPHALAMRSLDVEKLDCDFYAASCHKWLSAPFGSGFLYAHPRVQQQVQPVVRSWGGWPQQGSAWRKEFTWAGTRDPSAYLAIPTAIDFLESAGLDAFRSQTHALACYARNTLSQLTELAPLVPDDIAWFGSMVAVPLPPGEAKPLQQALWQRWQIEVPIVEWNGRRLVRVSCHLYNRRADIDRLAAALEELLRAETTG